MTVIDIDARARMRGIDPALYRVASRNFVILRSQMLVRGESIDLVSVLKTMPEDQSIAYVKYNNLDKERPDIFGQDGRMLANE